MNWEEILNLLLDQSINPNSMSAKRNLEQFRKEIFDLVSNNKLPQAIGKLIELYKSPKGTYYDDLLMLSRQFKDLTDRQMSGLIDDQAANIEKNRITHGLINIIANLESDPVAAEHFGITKGDSPIQKRGDRSAKLSFLVWLVPVVLLSVFLGFYFNQPQPEEKEIQQEIINEPARQNTRETTKQNNPTQKDIAQPKTEADNTKQIESPTAGEQTAPSENKGTPPPPPPSESRNNTPDKAIIIKAGELNLGHLQDGRDKHYFKYTATQSGNVNFVLNNRSKELTPYIIITRPDGVGLLSKSSVRGTNIEDLFKARQGETYLIQITGRGTSFGAYEFKIFN